MDFQLAGALILVGASCGYLVWRGWRLRSVSKGKCAGGCGCSATGNSTRESAAVVAISLEKLSPSAGRPDEKAAGPALPNAK
jgi:hypothetical protein